MIIRLRILALLLTIGWHFSIFSLPLIKAKAQGYTGRCFLLVNSRWSEAKQMTYSDCIWKVAAQFENSTEDKRFGQWQNVLILVESTGKVYSAEVAAKPIWIYRQTITLPGVGVCRYLNGYVMQLEDTRRLISIFGNLPCGQYWVESGYLWQMDKYGNWQRIGPVYQQAPNNSYDPCSDPNLMRLDYIPPGC